MKQRSIYLIAGILSTAFIMYVTSEETLVEKAKETALSAIGHATTAPEKMLLTPEQRAKRIAELRAHVAQSEVKLPPEELRQAFFEYILIQCADLFQGLADALGDGVTKISGDPRAGAAVKRLPAALADGVYLTSYLIKAMANKEYFDALKSLHSALNCLLQKSARQTSACAAYSSLPKALSGVFEYAPKVVMPIAQVSILGIKVGDRNIKGLIPLGIAVVAPETQVVKDEDVIREVVNVMFAFLSQLKSFENNVGAVGVSSSSLSPFSDMGNQSTKESDTTITPAEQEAYKKLASQNAQAQQIFKDLQVFAALSHEMSKLIPEERSINGVVIPLREMAQAAIACLYNIGELGLGIIAIMDEKIPELAHLTSCLKYTNEELKEASTKKTFVDAYVEQCAAFGCKNKRQCIAKTLIGIVKSIKLIFDTIVVKYDPQTQTSQRGLLMNIDVIIDRFMKILLTSKPVQNALNAINSKGLEQAVDFSKKINSLRTLIKFFGQSLSGIMEAFIFAVGQLDFDSLPSDIKNEYTEVVQEGVYHDAISDEDLDQLFAELTSERRGA